MEKDDALAFSEVPDDAGVQLPHMPQFKEPIAKSLRERFAMILSVPEFCQSGSHRLMIRRIGSPQLLQELPNGACAVGSLVKLYAELHAQQHLF